MEKELWMDINDYPSYQISNFGRVKSKGNNKAKREKILIGAIGNHGYRVVNLSKESKTNVFTVHSLVANHFIDKISNGYELVVNHKDFNKLNNHIDNLEIVSPRENTNKKHIKSTSKYVGVSWNKFANKWRAGIQINGKVKYLGYYINEYDAHLAYEKALNFHLTNKN